MTRTRAPGRTVDGERTLETVVGVRPGVSDRRIVLLAHRDALSSPAVAELSGTAALLELARVFRTREPGSQAPGGRPGRPQLIGRDLRKTLVLVSTSGGSGGAAGARAWARQADAGQIDGVLVLGDLASRAARKPWVVPWSNGRDQPPLRWRRTVEVALRQETSRHPGGSRAAAQWIRRAVPLTVSEQGEVNREAVPAVLMQASGERGPAPRAAVSRRRMAEFGRAALRAVTALDAAGGRGAEPQDPFAGQADGIVTMRKVVPVWSVRLLVLCLLLPALLAAFDGFFRARRRHLPVGAWVAWTLAAGLAVPLTWAWLRVLAIAGALPAPRGPVLPADLPLTTAQSLALASAALPLAGGIVACRLLTRSAAATRGNPAAGGAGAAAAAVLTAVGARRVGRQSVRRRPAAARRPPVAVRRVAADAPARRWGWLALAAGLLGPLLVVLAELGGLDIGVLALARLWLVAMAGGHVTAWAALALAALVGCFATLVRVQRARARIAAVTPPPKLSTRGPAGTRGRARSAARRGPCAADLVHWAPMRRALRLLALVMIVAGGLLLADGVATLAWREPVTSVYAGAQQARLDSRLRTVERRVHRADSARGPAPRGPRRAPAGGAGRAARAGARTGDRAARGRRGGHGPGRPAPRARPLSGHAAARARGTVALAGHRTTYGAQFRRLDDLRRGDRVELAMPYGRFAYRVERTRIVAPTATWVTRRVSYDRLVLTACHPLFSAAERIVVFARLVSARPV